MRTTLASPSRTVHIYRPRNNCLRLLHERGDEVLLSGPAGTGKSRACLEKLNLMALANPRMRGLIVRKTLASLGASALKTWRDDVVTELITNGSLHYYGGSQEEPPQYRYENGSAVFIGGMDKPTKVMSTEYDFIYVQEATELSLKDWEHLTSRLRNGRVSFQQIVADCNPDADTHWLKRRADDNKTLLLESRHEDNPRLFGADGKLTEYGTNYMRKLDRLTGVTYLRLRKGLWVGSEGMVYDEWDPILHHVEPFPIPEDWKRYWSIDWGYTNPFVCQMWAEDPDGRLWLYREFYGTGRGVGDWANDILNSVTDSDGNWTEPRPQAIITDHDPERQKAFEKAIGLRVIQANKTVGAGIDAVKERFIKAGDGKPRIYILKNCLVKTDESLKDAGKPTCTAEEVTGYVWATNGKDEPKKENDHGMDPMRYIVVYRDLKPKYNIRSF